MKNSKENVARFFGDDSADYLKHQYTHGADSFMSLRREHAAALIRQHLLPRLDESCRFLDAGCGPGILLQVLGDYPIEYSGVDISEEMLRLAREQARACPNKGLRAQFRQGDVEHLPFEADTFDVAASLGVIEYLNGDDALLGELRRVTRPDGFILLAVTNRYSYNLLFEKILHALRRGRLTAAMLSALKKLLGRGEFKQRAFVIRRHSIAHFMEGLEKHGLQVVASARWGFNFLPHPFHFLCGRGLNGFANRLYGKARGRWVRSLGEGFLVLCRKQPVPQP